MRDTTRQALNIALTHLTVQQQELETAVAALRAVLLEVDMLRVEPRQETTAPRPARARRTAPARRSGKAVPTDTSEETSAPTGRVVAGKWRERALTALRADATPASVNTLLTRLRVKDHERQAAYASLWAALKALVADGVVVKTGREYALGRQGAAA